MRQHKRVLPKTKKERKLKQKRRSKNRCKRYGTEKLEALVDFNTKLLKNIQKKTKLYS